MRQIKKFSKRSITSVVVLYIATAGIYGVYLTILQEFTVYKLTGKLRDALIAIVLSISTVLFIVQIIYGISYFSLHDSRTDISRTIGSIFLFAAVTITLVYFVGTLASIRIAGTVRELQMQMNYEPKVSKLCSEKKAAFWTLASFLSSIYLQYHMNQIKDKNK